MSFDPNDLDDPAMDADMFSEVTNADEPDTAVATYDGRGILNLLRNVGMENLMNQQQIATALDSIFKYVLSGGKEGKPPSWFATVMAWRAIGKVDPEVIKKNPMLWEQRLQVWNQAMTAAEGYAKAEVDERNRAAAQTNGHGSRIIHVHSTNNKRGN